MNDPSEEHPSDENRGDDEHGLSDRNSVLVESLLAGEQRALARVLSKIENRTAGSRDILAALYDRTGSTPVLGVTGSPGAGKSTLVDKLTKQYRARDETVGILAVDPASPYTGGSVLGDRIRMGAAAGDRGVFIRSMSARGALGGLSMATADAVVALDAFGLDRIIIETVGAGQSEVDVVETADSVAVVVQPGSGDDVQLLKAGILEIGDLFVVNKADRPEAAGTVADLEEMIHLRSPSADGRRTPTGGHHAPDTADHHGGDFATAEDPQNESPAGGGEVDGDRWTPPVLETVATTAVGVPELIEAIDRHQRYLDRSGGDTERRRRRATAALERLLQRDLGVLSEQLIETRGGIDSLAGAIARRETDPYSVVDDLIEPIETAVERAKTEGTESDANRSQH